LNKETSPTICRSILCALQGPKPDWERLKTHQFAAVKINKVNLFF